VVKVVLGALFYWQVAQVLVVLHDKTGDSGMRVVCNKGGLSANVEQGKGLGHGLLHARPVCLR
jgi:hypothetical protein